MKRFLFISAIFCLFTAVLLLTQQTLLLSAFRQVFTETQNPVEPTVQDVPKDVFSCNKDEDCIEVQLGCCNCGGGGQQTAIHRNQTDVWQQATDELCGAMTLCLAVISHDPSCFQHAACVRGNCVLR